jgi:protocatechuate 3,4-dioxygenase beta subunit
VKTFSAPLLAVAALAGTLTAQAPQIPAGAAAPGVVPPSPPAISADAPGSVQGRIVAAETGKALHRARVQLNRISNAQPRVTRDSLTNRDGRYRFDNLPPGQYSIRASFPGYIEMQGGQEDPDQWTGFSEVRPGQLEQVNFNLRRGGVLIGRITDDGGEPLAGVAVSPLRLEYTASGPQLRPVYLPFTGRTDDRGEFRASGLRPGTYVVAAALQTDVVGESYATTYYPGTTSHNEAQRVKIAFNEQITASFSMMTTMQVRVSGQVQSSTGELLKNYRAMLTRQLNVNSMGAQVDARTGLFEFKGISPGVYVLEVTATNDLQRTAKASEFAAVPMVVGNDDITGLLITTGNGVTLSGRVIYEGTAATDVAISQRPRVFVSRVDGPRGFFRQPNPQTNGLIAGDGTFSVTGAHGTVLLRAAIAGWQLRSVVLDGVDITDVPYDTSRGGTNKLEVFVTDQKQELTGRVTDSSGKPPSQFKVLAFPRNLKPGIVAGRYMVQATDYSSDGTFHLTNLPPGDYFAVAVRSAADNAMFDLELHEALKPRATPFQLSPGETAKIELTLIE